MAAGKHRSAADPRLFFLYELYDDAAAIRVHLRAPQFLQMNAATAEGVKGEAVLSLHRRLP